MNHPPESRDSMVSVSSIPVYLDHGQLHHRTMSQRQQEPACRQNLNILRPRQNGRHFPDAILKCIFFNENVWIFVTISLKFVPKGPINNIPALVQIMAWRRPGDKPLSEPMLASLLRHICIILPQRLNTRIATRFHKFSSAILNYHLVNNDDKASLESTETSMKISLLFSSAVQHCGCRWPSTVRC